MLAAVGAASAALRGSFALSPSTVAAARFDGPLAKALGGFQRQMATLTAMEMEVTVEPLDGNNEGIFQLTLNRPQARNAIGRKLLQELRYCPSLASYAWDWECIFDAKGDKRTMQRCCLQGYSSESGRFYCGFIVRLGCRVHSGSPHRQARGMAMLECCSLTFGRSCCPPLSREALDSVARERTTRCVVVRSLVPGVFCSGADLKERNSMTRQEAETFVSLLRSTFTKLEVMDDLC